MDSFGDSREAAKGAKMACPTEGFSIHGDRATRTSMRYQGGFAARAASSRLCVFARTS
jgi:hypothetical protein